MGANIIDHIASFVILLGLLTITVTTTTQVLDNIYNYHLSQEINTIGTNLLNSLIENTGTPNDWSQSSVNPTSIGLRWAIGEGYYINPFVPMRMMNSTITQIYGANIYDDLSSTPLSPWPGANLYFKKNDGVTYDQASKLLNTNGTYGWRVTYTPELSIEVSSSNPSIDSWYAGWGYRMAITIDHTKVPATMSNYPLLISITQSSFTLKAQPDGGDILFTTSDKLTKIPHEIDSYDGTTGKLKVWVKIPQLSSTTDTVIYIYYGNPTAANQASPSLVWAGYSTVDHLEDNPDSSHITDSSPNTLTGSKVGDHEPAETSSGIISVAQNFDGSNDYIALSQTTLTSGTEFFEMWIKSVQAATPQTILTSGFKNNTVGFIDISRPASSDDLSFDYAANSNWIRRTNGLNDGVKINCVTSFNGNIYCGTSTGGLFVWNSATSRWDIKASCIGSISPVNSLVVFNNMLYGGTTDGCLFQWNGTSAWLPKASQLNGQAVNCLAVYNSKLYCGTRPSGSLFEWDGISTWLQRAGQLNSQTSINSLTVFNSKLYGGTSPGGHLFEWTTGANIWTERAPQLGTETSINSLASFNNKLYGGTSPGGRLFEWDGTNNIWIGKTYILGSETSILSMAVYNGKLYGGTSPSGLLYEWDGATKWVKMADSLNSQTAIPALTVLNNKLYGASQGDGYLFECSDSGSRIIPNFFTGYNNKWVNIDIKADYTHGTIDFYRNGTRLPTQLISSTMIHSNSTPKYIGAYAVSGTAFNPFIGAIDEFRISQAAQDQNWITLSNNNERSPASFTVSSSEESSFFTVKARVMGKNGPINNANVSGTLLYCLPGAITPSISQITSQTSISDSMGAVSMIFPGFTPATGVYCILMRANHNGINGAGYLVNSPSLSTDPLGVMITDYTNGTMTLVHRKDLQVSYSDSNDVGYNATFAMPIGTSSYRSVNLGSAGILGLGITKKVQLGAMKESSGVLLVFYKNSAGKYGVTYTPWGVSALSLEAKFGAPIMDATNIITKTRIVNIESYTYEVKVEVWKIGG